MINFPKRKKETAGGSGQQFLWDAKDQHDELFYNYAKAVENYDSFDDFWDAFQAQSWEIFEGVCKASYRNGIARGQRRQKSRAT